MLHEHVAPRLARLLDGHTRLDRRAAPANVGEPWPGRLDGIHERLDLARSELLLGHRDFFPAVLGVDVQPVGRLANVPALAAHHDEPEEILLADLLVPGVEPVEGVLG